MITLFEGVWVWFDVAKVEYGSEIHNGGLSRSTVVACFNDSQWIVSLGG